MFNRLAAEIDKRLGSDSTSMSNSEWLCTNTSLGGKKFSLRGFEFQRAILDDMSTDLCVQKPSQIGSTETQIRKALAFLVRNNGTSLIYTLPNEDMYKRISRARIKPIVTKDKIFMPREGETRAQDQMQFRSSFLYVAPASEAAATSIASDANFIDEQDLSDPRWVALLSSRLQGSSWKISQKFSTPKYTSYGINGEFAVSDQRHYVCKCSSCGHYNMPEFSNAFVNIPGLDLPNLIASPLKLNENHLQTIDLSKAYIQCENCKRPLNLNSPLREWVATYPSRVNTRGYMISPFVNSSIGLPYILQRLLFFRRRDFMQGFYNTVLGIPYTDEELQLPRALIEKAFTSSPEPPILSSDIPCCIGIDVGKTCHIVVGYYTDKFNIVTTTSVVVADLDDKVKELSTMFSIRFGAIDRNPYTPEANRLRDETSGMILPVEYGHALQRAITITKDEYGNTSHARIDRTSCLDAVSSYLRAGNLTVAGYGNNKNTYLAHLQNMARERGEDNQPAKWVKLSTEDHFFHATAYAMIAPQLKGVEVYKLPSDLQRTQVFLSEIHQSPVQDSLPVF